MHWISLLLLSFGLSAAELPKFLTKQASDSLRYISMDGRYTYVQRKPGVLSLITSFKNADFLSESEVNDFRVRSSRFKIRLTIESIPNVHEVMSLLKNHTILVVDYGNTLTRKVGIGRSPRLHLRDEWITFYDIQTKIIHIQNLITQKKYEIRLSKKDNPFFIPEVEMISDRAVVYSDINDNGYSALVSYDLQTLKSNIIYKSPQTATKIELCQQEGYLGIGEFPYEGVSRGSKIQMININNIVNLAGYQTIYESVEQDIGNMICRPHAIYFIKTFAHNKELNDRTTEVVKLETKTQNLETKSNLKHVTQMIEMDNRVLIPLRGDLYVVEGTSNLGTDVLKSAPSKEELQIDI